MSHSENASKMAQLIDDLLAFLALMRGNWSGTMFSADELVRHVWAQLIEEKAGKAELELNVLPPMNAG
jgi:hypothetical protein